MKKIIEQILAYFWPVILDEEIHGEEFNEICNSELALLFTRKYRLFGPAEYLQK